MFSDDVDLGDVSPAVNALLQEGIIAYRTDRSRADALFRAALALSPEDLAPYFCLYKIHTYMGHLDTAAEVATKGLQEAARQARWPANPAQWPVSSPADGGPARFALFTLKALAFIELKRERPDVTQTYLNILAALDPTGRVGWTVIADLAGATRAS